MSKIASYGLADSPLQLSDRLIGTEAPRPQPTTTPLATKNFSLGELLHLFSDNFPAASLQAVLDTNNTATQNINLTGTISSTLIKPTNIEDSLGSQGTVFQVLSKSVGGINWIDIPVNYPTLNEVLNQGNVSILDAKIGKIYLYNPHTPSGNGYVNISGEKNRFNFYDNTDKLLANISKDTLSFGDFSSPYIFSIKKPTIISANHTATLQDTSGVIAYLSDIPTPISLTTLGDSGPATLIGGILNIPVYSGGSAYTFSSPLSESLGVVSISQASTISDGYLSLSDFNTFNNKQDSITLTTTGSSGPSTFIANVLNIPEYTLSSLGGVPYIGATQNVDLGEYQIKAGQVEFDTTPTGNAGVGIMRWNDSDGTLDLGLKGGNVTLQVGQEQVVRVVNKTGSDLLESNYQAVRVTGAQGQRLKVDLAQATNDLLSAETIGLVTENIDNNQEGFVTTSGLIRGINTTGSLQGETWADGDMLYLSPSVAGRITNIKPSAPNHLIVVGYVVHSHANNGSIFVKVDNGYELEELHNVTETNYTTPIDTDSVLTFDVNNSLWKRLSWANIKSNLKTYFDTIYQTALGFIPENVANKANDLTSPDNTKYPTTLAVSTALNDKQDTLTNPITGTGTNGQVAFFNGTTTQTGDNGLFWDNTNKRLGVGTNVPQRKLDVNGDFRAGNLIIRPSSNLSVIENAGTGNSILFIRSGGTNPLVLNDVGGGVIIGVSATPGARLDVRAQGALSTDIAFRVRNSVDTANLMTVDGTGLLSTLSITLGTPSLDNNIRFGGNNTRIFNSASDNSLNFQNVFSASTIFRFRTNSDLPNTNTSGTNTFMSLPIGFAPTSGTGTWTQLSLTATINQTGGANGITRGLYINPTLTSAFDFRAIEVSSGGVYVNTTNVQASAILQADSTTKGFLPPRMTNAQRLGIASPAVGLMVYCTDATEGLYVNKSTGWTFII